MLLGQCYTKVVKSQLLFFFGQHIHTFRTKAGNICIQTNQGNKTLCSQHHSETVLWVIETLTSVICISNSSTSTYFAQMPQLLICSSQEFQLILSEKNRTF